MRVILIHPHDPTTHHIGGIGTFLNTFVKYAPSDFSIALVGVTRYPTRSPVGRWQSVTVAGRSLDFLPIVAAPELRRSKIPLSLRFTWALRKYRSIIEFRDALLEFHRIEPALAFRKVRAPKILFLHGHMRDLYHPKTEVRWGKFPALYFWFERQLISEMERIYVVREDAVPFYRSRYPWLENRIRFLPTWVDDSVFFICPEGDRRRLRKELSEKHRLNPAARWLLFVGRFEGQKNPLLLLDAFSQLNGRVGAADLIMIGVGNLENKMRAFVEKKEMAPSVRMLPPMPQSEVAQWMNVADCLCLSSAFEGMPRVVLEALSCGLPVVTTDVGEVRRLLGDSRAGRLVPQQEACAFSQALVDLLERMPSREACREVAAPFAAENILRPVYAGYRIAAQKKERSG